MRFGTPGTNTNANPPFCRPEGISHQKGLNEPKFSGRWVGKELFFAKLENFVSRARIIQHIRAQSDRKYGSRIKYHHTHALVGGNLPAGGAPHPNLLVLVCIEALYVALDPANALKFKM